MAVNDSPSGRLAHAFTYTFDYSRDDPGQAFVSLLMPPGSLHFDGGGVLFPAMNMNLPEGYLFMQIREFFPKQTITPTHLLALMGNNGIGRLGYRLPDAPRDHRTGLGQQCRFAGQRQWPRPVSGADARVPVHRRGHIGHPAQDHGARQGHRRRAHADRQDGR